MIRLFAVLLAAVAVISFYFMPEVAAGNYADAWKALAPNLVVEAFGLCLAVAFAEWFLRNYRKRNGLEKIAPTLMRQIGPAIHLDNTILSETQLTPKEFGRVLKEYIEGKYDPVHIPADFSEKLKQSIDKVAPKDIVRASQALTRTSSFAGRFASLLDEEHIILLESAVSNFDEFANRVGDTSSTPKDIAEAFLDVHDDLEDIGELFEFDRTIKRINAAS